MILEGIVEAERAGARLAQACAVVGLSLRTVQRWRKGGGGTDKRTTNAHPTPVNALSPAERSEVLRVMNTAEFRDLSPNQIVPQLADRGIYVASESTMYRILRAEGQLVHRGRARPAEARPRPEHVATGPNQVWTWDISYLRTPVRGIYFYLYLMIDMWSRKIVGWTVAEQENEHVAARLFRDVCAAEGLNPSGLILHSDNGGPMKGSIMLATLYELGVAASFSRPRVSNDNPYSEALFRTLKYRPDYPTKPFANCESARRWVDAFVSWYNQHHLHSAIRFVSPALRHAGRDSALLARRKQVYEAARKRRPQRWTGPTRNWEPIDMVRLLPGKELKRAS